ncbi:hypothetical protein [Paraclostridium bifermentans]|uniref:hypothetical protein n=1 Tax=Paraclostridium bifermentans TaxID=1490 RepID=UPI00359CA574
MDKYEKIVYGIIVAMGIAFIVFINMDFTGHKMKFEENIIKIDGEVIKVEDIESIELLDDVYIGNKISGANTFTYSRGSFKVGGNKEGRVYIYNDSKPYIQIITKDKLYIYNDKEGSETEKTYGELIIRYNIKSNSNVEIGKFVK